METFPLPGDRRVTSPRARFRRHSVMTWLRFMMIGWWIWRTHRRLWWSFGRLRRFEAWGCRRWCSGSSADGGIGRWSPWSDMSTDLWRVASLLSRSCCTRCHGCFRRVLTPADPCWATLCRWDWFEALDLASFAAESFGPRICCTQAGVRRCREGTWRSWACWCRREGDKAGQSRRTLPLFVAGKLPLVASSSALLVCRRAPMGTDNESLPKNENSRNQNFTLHF